MVAGARGGAATVRRGVRVGEAIGSATLGENDVLVLAAERIASMGERE
jgi:hypothetical protein